MLSQYKPARPRRGITVPCQNCHQPFRTSVTRQEDGRGKFCGKPCYYQATGRIVACLGCGKEFRARLCKVKTGHEKYCERGCYDARSEQRKVGRFWASVEKTETCWLWLAGKTPAGYGRFNLRNGYVMAHRVAYELAKGPIPDGLVLDHLCRTPLCVNPAHLEAVTVQTNTLRGVGYSALNARKTTCKQGHPYDKVDIRGGRDCSICRRVYHREYQRRKARLRREQKEAA